jgi:hypothetical protein
MPSKYDGTVVVIPTRNRAALACRSIRSALPEAGPGVHVLVSDNSTLPAASAELAGYCRRQRHPRLTLVRPPRAMSMPEHWDWALGQALALPGATHVLYLTDRMAFLRGQLTRLLRLTAENPGVIVSYDNDVIEDAAAPVRFRAKALTGSVIPVGGPHLLYLASQSIFPQCLPRLLNCIAPREVLEAVRARFGDVCRSSVAPDFCHAYRSLGLVDHILYLDDTAVIHFGLAESNGHGLFRSEPNAALNDFLANLGPGGLAPDTPAPEIRTNLNAVFQEYCSTRRRAGTPDYPPLDRGRYLDAIAGELGHTRNEAVVRHAEECLRRHGWARPSPQPTADEVPSAPKARWRLLLEGAAALTRARIAGRAGHPEPTFHFATLDDALWFAQRWPRRRTDSENHLSFLQRGWRLAA